MALKNLERLRKGFTDLTQSKLAEAVGLSLSDYKRLISGERELTISEVDRFAGYFKVNSDVITDKIELTKATLVEEKPLVYAKAMTKAQVMVPLDGTSETLDAWIITLRRLNNALSIG